MDSGTVKVTTRSGATLTSDNVLCALRGVEERKAAEELRKCNAAKARELRQNEKIIKDAEAQQKRLIREE